MGSDETLDSEDSQLNLILLGSDGLAQELEKEIRVSHTILVILVPQVIIIVHQFSARKYTYLEQG